MRTGEDTTADALFGGSLSVVQPRTGYRFNVDSLWLAAFAGRGQGVRQVLDLGAGVGVVTLCLHHLGGVSRAVLVERDARLAELCERNLERAGLAARVLCADLGRGLPKAAREGAELVVANPPYFEPGERRPARADREPSRAGALAPFVRAAALALGPSRSRAAFVYPARSLGRLLALCERSGLVPKRLRFVHAFAADPARVALVELRRAKPGGLVVEPPVVEWQGAGVPSPELARLSAGRAGDRS
ncbi:MAG: methyltransferase [Myxococcales bacterium]|nr:methyltransferase [Myxococcales bacterium]